MERLKLTSICVFILGMVTFAVGWFIVDTFVFVERPSMDGIIEDWERICFWPEEDGIHAAVSPKGCYSTTCTAPKLRTGTAVVDIWDYTIQFETRFVLVEESRYPLPCIENCAGGGTVRFHLGALVPNVYDVGFRGEKVGELHINSGIPTPRQCLENIE
jgi:hypothetical protein